MRFLKKFFYRAFTIDGALGLRYRVDRYSALDRHVIDKGLFSDWIGKQGHLFLPDDATILDVGANAGLLTLLFATAIAPHGRIISYEPDPENLQRLRANISLNSLRNVDVRAVAIQDDPIREVADFHIRRAVDGDGLENRGLSSLVDIQLHRCKTARVATSTIDKEISTLGLTRVDLIKLDVEGAELMALTGAITTLRRHRPFIHYEYSLALDSIAGTRNAPGSFSLIEHLGYQQYLIANEQHLRHIHSHTEITADANILAVPDRLPKTLATFTDSP